MSVEQHENMFLSCVKNLSQIGFVAMLGLLFPFYEPSVRLLCLSLAAYLLLLALPFFLVPGYFEQGEHFGGCRAATSPYRGSPCAASVWL